MAKGARLLLLPLVAVIAASVSLPGDRAGRLAAAAGDPAVESLTAQLELERKARAEDLVDLTRLTDSVGRFSLEVSDRRQRLVEVLRAASPRAEALDEAQESLEESEARFRAVDDRRRAVAARLVERGRRVSLLLDEIARRRGRLRGSPDPVTGRWDWTIDPGARKGTMNLRLDGTIVTGEYVLDGGFRGSVRGTFIAEKLSLQRVDAERGIDANFYGRMTLGPRRLAGTWEATAIAPTPGAVAGTWSATVAPEKDDGSDDVR